MNTGADDSELVGPEKLSSEELIIDGGAVEDLSQNSLVNFLKQGFLSEIEQKGRIKQYSTRKTVIRLAFLGGVLISMIASLVYYLGKEFPVRFAKLCGFSSSETANKVGSFFGVSGVIMNILFYTWNIKVLLPPVYPVQAQFEKESLNNHQSNVLQKLQYYFRGRFSAVAEWVLALASTIPITYLSYQREKNKENTFVSYTIVFSTGFIWAISSKFSLHISHQRFAAAFAWLKERLSKHNSESSTPDLLSQAKNAFLLAATYSSQKMHHLSDEERHNLVVSLGDLLQKQPEHRWQALLELSFGDLSSAPKKIEMHNVAMIIGMAIFTVFSNAGVIMTGPEAIAGFTNSTFLRYLLFFLQALPLVERSLAIGGMRGLEFSRIRDPGRSIVQQVTPRCLRLVGYLPLTILGVASCGMTGALAIKKFSSPLIWFILPSATLGTSLVIASGGVTLWNEILIRIAQQADPSLKVFIDYINFSKALQSQIKGAQKEEFAKLILNLSPEIQAKIKNFIPEMKDRSAGDFQSSLELALKNNSSLFFNSSRRRGSKTEITSFNLGEVDESSSASSLRV